MRIPGILKSPYILMVVVSDICPSLAWSTPSSTCRSPEAVTAAQVSSNDRLSTSGYLMNAIEDNNRRKLFHCVESCAFILVGGTAAPHACHAEEIDPFAAMDAAISAGLSPGSSTSQGTGTPAASNSNSQPMTPSKEASSKNASPSMTSSDLEKALNESQRRKSIDPRTHG